MTRTTYYNLNIVEGSDLVNPLTQTNPNFTAIDAVLHENALAGVGLATELKTGTVHALVRNGDIDTPVFHFVATADYVLNDSFTVDGAVVSAVLPNGLPLPNAAYKVNSDVLCIITGNHLTVFTSADINALTEMVQTNTNNIAVHNEQAGNVNNLETEAKVIVDAINEVNAKTGSDIVTLYGTFGNTVGNASSVSYPAGLTSDNSVILSLEIELAASTFIPTYSNGIQYADYTMFSSYIAVTTRYSAANGKRFRLSIKKI